MVNIIIIEKNGSLKELLIKKFNIDELYKKCQYRKKDGLKNNMNGQ